MARFRTTRRVAVFAAASLLLAACADLRVTPLGQITAINGSQASVVHLGQTAPASVGQPIYPGDQFSTGDATTMRISLYSGVILDLQQDTDPTLLQDAQCLLIQLFNWGEIYVSGSKVCVDSSPNAAIQYSNVDYRILPPTAGGSRGLRITVLSGEVHSRRPPGTVVTTGYQVDLRNGVAVGPPVPASRFELRRIRAWTSLNGTSPAGRFTPGATMTPPARQGPPVQVQ